MQKHRKPPDPTTNREIDGERLKLELQAPPLPPALPTTAPHNPNSPSYEHRAELRRVVAERWAARL